MFAVDCMEMCAQNGYCSIGRELQKRSISELEKGFHHDRSVLPMMDVELAYPSPLFEMHAESVGKKQFSHDGLLPMVLHNRLDYFDIGIDLVDSPQEEEYYGDLMGDGLESLHVEASSISKFNLDQIHMILRLAQRKHGGATLREIFYAPNHMRRLLGNKDDGRGMPWEVMDRKCGKNAVVTTFYSHLMNPFVLLQVDWREISSKFQSSSTLVTHGSGFAAKRMIRNLILAKNFQYCSDCSFLGVLNFENPYFEKLQIWAFLDHSAS
ncbi:hypothetical protein SUGI_0753400 [Cryptomeria japonica]|nr:hypothetical protein SUGI_0753400 [Cryptomeria japonica]